MPVWKMSLKIIKLYYSLKFTVIGYYKTGNSESTAELSADCIMDGSRAWQVDAP